MSISIFLAFLFGKVKQKEFLIYTVWMIFIFFIVVSLRALVTGNMPDWALFVILVIGVLGLIVDGTIVYKTYIRKK